MYTPVCVQRYRWFRETLSLLLVSAAALAPGHVFAQQNPCDDDYVTVSPTEVGVAPTGDDDTGNLQCAFDAAAGQGIPLVQLQSASYTTDPLIIVGFEGTFSGVTRTGTAIDLTPGLLDCSDIVSEPAGVFKFVESSPRLQNLTIRSTSFLCSNNNTFGAQVLIAGTAFGPDCQDVVVFPVIDRVDFKQSSQTIGANVGLNFQHGKGPDDACATRRLLGQATVNRASFEQFHRGILVRMHGRALVNIRLSDFVNNRASIITGGGSQELTISNNTFLNSFEGRHSPAQIAGQWDSANDAANDRLVIYRNQFLIDMPADAPLQNGRAILLRRSVDAASVQVAISNNRIESPVRTGGPGIGVQGISGGVITGNAFAGNWQNGTIQLTRIDDLQTNNWSIVDNNSAGLTGGNNILLFEGANNNVIGPGQGTVVDFAGTNIVIP